MSPSTGDGPPTASEVLHISKHVLKVTDPHQQWRTEALGLYKMGLSPAEIAQAQGVRLQSNTRLAHSGKASIVKINWKQCVELLLELHFGSHAPAHGRICVC